MPKKVGTGSLRAVEPKTDKHPAYKGSLTIDGRKYWLSGWKRVGDDGKAWLSLSVDLTEQAVPQRNLALAGTDLDNDVDF